MPSSNTPPTILTTLLALTLAMPLGCSDDGEKQDEEAGDEIGDDGIERPPEVCKSSCRECADLMKDPYACMPVDEFEEPVDGFECMVCENDGPGTAAVTCGTQASLQSFVYATMEAQVVACDGSTAAAQCTVWNPDAYVRPTRDNEWDVERDFIDALVADPSQLVACDGARVKPFSGFYRVTSVESDDLLGRIGLMDGDVIQSINAYPMSGPYDAALAFFELWPDTQVFTVSVLRPGVGALTFTYNLV